ncbi:hypothetical protein R1sor_008277 [Riccia sorocarpa]|uniref:Uncharacterized protein n=1 Tax=Riccia sorocarpa TaxID=122646 RepID=A0ABD3HV31_9MARC
MEFHFPVLASRLMKEYPKHLVVYRSGNGRGTADKQDGSSSNNICHITEIRIMRANCRLELGQDYFLVHIPEQYLEHFSKYIKVSDRQVAPAPDDETLQSLTQASALEVSEASTAAPLGKSARKGSRTLRNPSSYPALQKRKDTMMHSKTGTRSSMISKTGSKSSRMRNYLGLAAIIDISILSMVVEIGSLR